MTPQEILTKLQDHEQCRSVALDVVRHQHVPCEGWRWLIRHYPFGAWLSAVASTPDFPLDHIVVEHVLRHVPPYEERLDLLEAAIRRGNLDYADEWWRELAATDATRATKVLVDLPLQRREQLTLGDLDNARIWDYLPQEEAAIVRHQAKPGVAGVRSERWKSVYLIAAHSVPDKLDTFGDFLSWPSNAEEAEVAVSVLRQSIGFRSWIHKIAGWPAGMLTEAIVTALLTTTTTAGRDLLHAHSANNTITAWVLGWTLDAWRGKHWLANHAVEGVAAELIFDTLERFLISHGSRLWRDLVETAVSTRSGSVARAALYTVLTHKDVTAEDLQWLLAGQDSIRDEKWRTTIMEHPVWQSCDSPGAPRSTLRVRLR